MRRGFFGVTSASLLGAVVLTTGCSGLGDAIGLSRRAPPDEFEVVTNAPLSLPPEFALRPPEPGATGPGTTTPQDQARAAVTGTAGSPDAGATTQGESALLANAGAVGVDPSIRTTVDAESSIEDESTSTWLADTLLFWRDTPPAGQVVDAAAEAQRIRANEAAGRPVTAGETPIIERTGEPIRLF
jgi:hypothetical protein